MVPIRSTFIYPEAVPSRHRFASPKPLRAGTARAPSRAVHTARIRPGATDDRQGSPGRSPHREEPLHNCSVVYPRSAFFLVNVWVACP